MFALFIANVLFFKDMSEVFFQTRNEEYQAASWLIALKTMQYLGERNALIPSNQQSASISACVRAYQKPEEFGNQLHKLSQSEAPVDSSEITSYKLMGAMDRQRKIHRGLSDAVSLLVEDDITRHVMQTPFVRLSPLMSELTDYSINRYAAPILDNSAQSVGIELAVQYTQVESDFYLSQYDPA